MTRKITEIRSKRRKTGYTMRQIARMLAIPYRTWRDWERGERECPNWVKKMMLKELRKIMEGKKF